MPKFRQEKCISAGLQHFHRVNHFCSVFHLMQYAAMIFRGKRAQWGQFPSQCGKMGVGGTVAMWQNPTSTPHISHLPQQSPPPRSSRCIGNFRNFRARLSLRIKCCSRCRNFSTTSRREYLVSSLTDNLACFEIRKQRRFVQR